MLLWIAVVGGLSPMMGHHTRSESLFYYFRLEDQVPEGHLLRMIDTHIDFSFVREQLKDSHGAEHQTPGPVLEHAGRGTGDDLE
jgi:hypothetical protein